MALKRIGSWKKRYKFLLVLGVLLLSISFAAFAYVQLAKPNYEGKLAIHEIQKETAVYFDEYGIPHIYAESETDAFEAKKDLDKLLSALPERQRLPIVHVKLEGLSVAETALRIGMSESAIKVGIHRGLKALAAKIREST